MLICGCEVLLDVHSKRVRGAEDPPRLRGESLKNGRCFGYVVTGRADIFTERICVSKVKPHIARIKFTERASHLGQQLDN